MARRSRPHYPHFVALLGILTVSQLHGQDLPDLSVVSRALQEGASTFLRSPEAQTAAQALQNAARSLQDTTQTVLSSPQAQTVASSLQNAASAVNQGTTSFLQTKQATDTASAVGAAAGSVLAAGARARDEGSHAVQDLVNSLVDEPESAKGPSASTPVLAEDVDAFVTAAPAPMAPAKHNSKASKSPMASVSPKKASSANPEPVGTAVKHKEAVEAWPALLPQPVPTVTSFASKAASTSAGGAAGNAAPDGLQLLQGLQAVISTAAQVAQASNGGAAIVPGPAGAPLGALETIAQTALNSPLFGQTGSQQALVVLPAAPREALPPGVDPQSAQRVRQAAQGAINSLTISRSPKEQSVLAQLTTAVQQQKSPQEIARDGVNDLVNNRAQDFLGAITGTSPPPPPPPASLQDTIASIVSGIATQASQSQLLQDVASSITQPQAAATATPSRAAGAGAAIAAKMPAGQSFLQQLPEVETDPVMDKVHELVQHGLP